MAALSTSEKILPPFLRQDEAEILLRQTYFPEVKVSFFSLFQYATMGDLVIIAISTMSALAAGAIIPLPTVPDLLLFHDQKLASPILI